MKQNNTIKNFSFLGIGRIITITLHALFYLLLAALLDPEIYGELSVIVALAGTFSIISSLGLNLSLQVYQAKNNSNVSAQITTLFLLSTSIAALILLFIDPIAALLCVCLSFFLLNQHRLLGLKKYKKHMICNILKSGTFLIIPISLYFVFDIYGIVLGMAISNFIGSLPIFRNITVKSFFDLKNYYKILINNFGVEASGQLSHTVDKLAIFSLFGFFIVGIYQFNFQVFLALTVLPHVLGAYLVTEESSGIGHRKLSYFVVLGSILLAVVAIILAPILVPVFFPKYSEGISALQVLVLSIIPMSINTIYHSKLLAKESTKIGFEIIVRIGSLLLFIVVLGEFYGLMGLSFAVLLSISTTTLFIYLLYHRSKSRIER
ncbi:MAG: membrane protein of unknown function [Nitrosopumilales archaeon]|nr:MAG: membrane protein of unknown function [Nitrosopumilales archaeon]